MRDRAGSGVFAGEVGVVGFGRCGALATQVLARRHAVIAMDHIDRSTEAAAVGAGWGDLAAVASRSVVLLAVPIRALPDALDAIAPHLAPDALVIDMASVKLRPLAWMAEHLPRGVRRVGTHPLFGPNSVHEQGLPGRRVAICPAPGHESAADEVAREARALGLAPIRVSAEEHDRQMARSQAIVFLLSRSLSRAGIEPASLGTPSEERLAAALALVGNDSDELYEDILRFNPFASETAARLASTMQAELDRVGGA